MLSTLMIIFPSLSAVAALSAVDERLNHFMEMQQTRIPSRNEFSNENITQLRSFPPLAAVHVWECKTVRHEYMVCCSEMKVKQPRSLKK